ncbi:MAG: ABC transporter permease [Pyrinomonadaceae bacterium]
MRKFWAIVKREYIQRVRSKMFIFVTILGPVVMSLFVAVPAVIFSIKAGGPVRIAVIDETHQLYAPLQMSITGDGAGFDQNGVVTREQGPSEGQGEKAPDLQVSFELQEMRLNGRSIEQAQAELSERVRANELDGYLILPANLLDGEDAEFFGRNTGDVFTRNTLENALSKVVGEQRLARANIDVNIVRELSRPVDLHSFKIGEGGAERDSGEGFFVVFGIGFAIYLTILMYGQIILGAVIEEKETRIAEILFSSLKPFALMMGKLIGISFVALTQLGIWSLALLAVITLAAPGLSFNIPRVPPVVFVYFALFFLMGYFIYATIYALIGSMVTTAQEGGQLAMPVILLLVIGFYLAFPVMRSPDSQLAFWVSLIPFFSPITMLVRIVSQTPPFWQIALSLVIGFGTAVLLCWLAARIYRVGMLMHGKRATIPEALRWARQV